MAAVRQHGQRVPFPMAQVRWNSRRDNEQKWLLPGACGKTHAQSSAWQHGHSRRTLAAAWSREAVEQDIRLNGQKDLRLYQHCMQIIIPYKKKHA